MSFASPLVGEWKYRSFLNRTAPVADDLKELKKLLWAEGTLEITKADPSELTGSGTFGPGYDVDLKGFCGFGLPVTVHMRAIGTGAENRGKWVYDYVGFLVSPWSHGVGQVSVIVGSVICSQAYEDEEGTHPVGEVASFIMVRMD